MNFPISCLYQKVCFQWKWEKKLLSNVITTNRKKILFPEYLMPISYYSLFVLISYFYLYTKSTLQRNKIAYVDFEIAVVGCTVAIRECKTNGNPDVEWKRKKRRIFLYKKKHRNLLFVNKYNILTPTYTNGYSVYFIISLNVYIGKGIFFGWE